MKLKAKFNRETLDVDLIINDILFEDIFKENYPTIIKKVLKYLSNVKEHNPKFLKEVLGIITVNYGKGGCDEEGFELKF